MNELTHEHSVNELQARFSELTEQIEAFRDEYDADFPADVDVLEYDAKTVDDVYADLSEWATAIKERRLHERARQKPTGSTAPSHS